MNEQLKMEFPCNHFYVYETPNGATSRGCCKYCGGVVEGVNSLDESWDNMNKLSFIKDRNYRAKDNDIDLILDNPKSRNFTLRGILRNA